MKLALNCHQAFDFYMQRMGSEFYDHPEVMAPVLRFWKEKGYEGITLYDSLPLFYDLGKDQLQRMKAVLDEAGLAVACMNLMRKTLFDPAVAEQEEARMYHTLEVCGEILKAEIMDLTVDPQFPVQRGPQLYERVYYRADYAPYEHFAVSAKILKKYARACAGYGMQVSLESKDDGLGDTAENLIKLIKMIDEPNVGANPDVGNCFRAPYPNSLNIQQEIVKLVPYTNYLEIKNYRRIWLASEHRFYTWVCDVDLGDIDFRDQMLRLWEYGFRGWVCNECGNGDPMGQGTWGDRWSTELCFWRWFREVVDEYIPLMTKVTIPK
jgi:sugar phosphate isomerase/epimerase